MIWQKIKWYFGSLICIAFHNKSNQLLGKFLWFFVTFKPLVIEKEYRKSSLSTNRSDVSLSEISVDIRFGAYLLTKWLMARIECHPCVGSLAITTSMARLSDDSSISERSLNLSIVEFIFQNDCPKCITILSDVCCDVFLDVVLSSDLIDNSSNSSILSFAGFPISPEDNAVS